MRCLLFLLAASHSAAAPTYANPVVPDPADTPDPGATFDAATQLFWAGTTTGNAPEGCFELRSSPDLAQWTLHGIIFTPDRLPTWIDPSNPSCWAPELHVVAGLWRLYFVGRQRNGLLSVGVATSAAGIAGPYVDSGAPLVQGRGANPQGQIDPTLVFNGTDPWLVWKTDGNADGLKTPIRAAPLAANGTALAPGFNWDATQLIANDLPWEDKIVEAPWFVVRDGYYFLFYSGNGYGDGTYAVGVARSRALLGPYEKRGAPILATSRGANPAFPGPGHCSVLAAADGKTVILYHAHSDATSKRHLMLDELVWGADGWPAMESGLPQPGVGPQPVPLSVIVM